MNSRILPFSMLLVCAWACGGDDDASGGPNGSAGEDPFGNAAGNGSSPGRNPTMSMSDGGGGVGGEPRLDTCGAEPFVANVREVNVLLVIDKSGSMLQVPEGFAVDKWTAMKASVPAALDGIKESLSLGLVMYPSNDGCDVPTDVTVGIANGASALPAINTALEQATPEGGTPTAVALQTAYTYFTDGAGADLGGDKFVLLATDGGPNCNAMLTCDISQCTSVIDGNCPMDVNCCDEALGTRAQQSCLDDDRSRRMVGELAAIGVPTFVVGIPGTEQYSGVLDALATAGERPRADAPPSYYAVTAQGNETGGLTDVLSSIAGSLIKTCRLQLGSTPPALDKINVKVDGDVIPQADAWEIDVATDPPTIQLLGETCSRVEMSGAESVEVLFGCPTILG